MNDKLILKAKELAENHDTKVKNEVMEELFNNWKKAGNAGKEFENNLWKQFNEHRNLFYKNRDKFFKEQKIQNKERYALKQELVVKAQEILDTNEYTIDNTKKFKDLNVEWKKIGFCGRENEQNVWDKFNGIAEKYFNNLKSISEEKKNQWTDRLENVIEDKKDRISKTQNSIDRLNNELIGAISERKIEDIKAEIEDKEDFIEELKLDIIDIQKKLDN